MKKRDIQIIVVLFLVALVGLVAVRMMGQSDGEESYVNIYVGDTEYERVSLNEPQVVVIDRDGKYNEIKISPDGAEMHDSNCDNQDCMLQGEITLDNVNTRLMGGWIVCLPNQVSIELVKEETK